MKYISVFVIIILAWIVASKVVVARNIECYTQFGQCSESLLQPASQLINTSLLLPLNSSEVVTTYKSMASVKSVKIFRRLPSTLVVSLELRSPLGLVGPDLTGTNAQLIDSDGIVLGTSSDPKTPLLVVDGFLSDTRSVSQNYVLSLQILQKIDQFSSVRVIGNLDGSLLTATYTGGPKILIDISDNMDRWQFPLQQILERSKITPKSPTKIDLRFKNPVLTY